MIHFAKMHGLGNDYLFVDARTKIPNNLTTLAQQMSDRHRGVGSDGLVLITRSSVADFGMRMFNADGSEAEMCGNAVRCIGRYVYEKGLTQKTEITLETKGGLKTLYLHCSAQGQIDTVKVDMGIYTYVGTKEIATTEGTKKGYVVEVGNPHVVLFYPMESHRPVHSLGKEIEHHELFPNRINVEFIKVIDRQNIDFRVWERGSGETMACGTGACAAAVAAWKSGQTDQNITVHLLGGDLQIQVADDQHVWMTGPATMVFEGEWPECSTGDKK